MNDDEFLNAIDSALRSLEARPVNPRGRRAILTAQVERLKKAIESGYIVSEIVAELKIHGAHVSRALINQILKPAEANARHKASQANRSCKARRSGTGLNKPAHVQINKQAGEKATGGVVLPATLQPSAYIEQGSKAYAD